MKQNFRFRTIPSAAILGLVALSSVVARAGEETWIKIENNAFSFSVPSSFKKTPQGGVDSFVEEYVAEDIKLSFDYGLYSDSFQDWPKETKFENVNVGGKEARVGTVNHEFYKGFPYSTQIYFKLDGNSLSMSADCKSENEVSLARKIFQSIHFNAQKTP